MTDEPPPIPSGYLRHAPGTDPTDREAVLALFVERLHSYGADVYQVADEQVAPTIATALRTHQAHRIIVAPGFPEAWLGGWHDSIVWDSAAMPAGDLDHFDAAVTTCAAAVADSGTIVLDGGPGQGRRAVTLLPDAHVCIVRDQQIASSIPEMIAAVEPSRALTWFSGPSATADIEMIRVSGVHGPRHLTVIVVRG
jgi:L-lactate dehydrogenase complex protein LldG